MAVEKLESLSETESSLDTWLYNEIHSVHIIVEIGNWKEQGELIYKSIRNWLYLYFSQGNMYKYIFLLNCWIQKDNKTSLLPFTSFTVCLY